MNVVDFLHMPRTAAPIYMSIIGAEQCLGLEHECWVLLLSELGIERYDAEIVALTRPIQEYHDTYWQTYYHDIDWWAQTNAITSIYNRNKQSKFQSFIELSMILFPMTIEPTDRIEWPEHVSKQILSLYRSRK